jgi:hypothetical protein
LWQLIAVGCHICKIHMDKRGLLLAFFVTALLPSGALHAHPVPKDDHDRIIKVRLDWDTQGKQVIVFVDYRLEVDPFTVVQDMRPFQEQIDPADRKSVV